MRTMMPGEDRGRNSGDVFTIQGASKTASKALEAWEKHWTDSQPSELWKESSLNSILSSDF